jgi:hypothetical protein
MPFSQKLPQLNKTIDLEYSLHPESTLIDYFKLFAQSAFGPGHLIKDLQSAKDNLLDEVQNSTAFDSALIQPCDYYSPFYRVNLILLKNESIPFDEFFNAFIESAACITPISEYLFKEEWLYIANLIKIKEIVKSDYEKDYSFISDLLAHNKFLCSHSNHFKSLYNPHYRIIHKLYLPCYFNKIFNL